MPEAHHKLGYPPENTFIPENPIEKKKPRADDEKPAPPTLISNTPKVWFKQDDSFDHPFIKLHLKI